MEASAQNQLNELAQEMIDKNICPELKDQATQLVMGSGNPAADILFIGEAPGRKEDESGKPFIGASGKFLNTMLESIGMDRDDVYITNIVKYRPPNNRDPKKAEKTAFYPYLAEEINIINPKIIISLGDHSMKSFMPDSKISEVHGELQDIKFEGRDMMIVPLYHPSYAFFNGGVRQTLVDDFMKLPAIIEKLNKS